MELAIVSVHTSVVFNDIIVFVVSEASMTLSPLAKRRLQIAPGRR